MTPSANWHYCFFTINLGSCVQRLPLSPSHSLWPPPPGPPPAPSVQASICRSDISVPGAIFFGGLLKNVNASKKIPKEKSRSFRLATRSLFFFFFSFFSVKRNRWFSSFFSGVFVWFASSVKSQANLNERGGRPEQMQQEIYSLQRQHCNFFKSFFNMIFFKNSPST